MTDTEVFFFYVFLSRGKERTAKVHMCICWRKAAIICLSGATSKQLFFFFDFLFVILVYVGHVFEIYRLSHTG